MPVPQKLREEEWVIIPISPGAWQVGVMGLTPETVSEVDLIKILKNRGLSDSEIRDTLDECLKDGKIWAQEATEESLPVSVTIGDNSYEVKIINGDEYTVFKNGEKIYATSNAVGPYALAELFLAMQGDWATEVETKIAGRDNPGDLIDKVTFEVFLQDMIERSQVIGEEDKEKLKTILEKMTGREWNVRQVSWEGRKQQSQFLSTYLMDKVQMALKMLAPLIALGDWRVMNAINILTTKIKAVRGEETTGQKIKGRRLLIDLFVAPINGNIEVRVDSKENWFSSWLQKLLKMRLEMDKVIADKLIGRKDPLWKRVGLNKKAGLKELDEDLKVEIKSILDKHNLNYKSTPDKFEIASSQITKLKPSEITQLHREIKRKGCMVMALPVGWLILKR